MLIEYPGKSWLAVGDGAFGRDGHYINSKGCNALSIDISTRRLQWAKQVGYIKNYMKINAEKMPFADNEFDFVLCKETFHHFQKPYMALYEMIRVAKKGVVLIEPTERGLDNFEPAGNYIFGINEREIQKLAMALGIPYVSSVYFNSTFIKNLRGPAHMDNPDFVKIVKAIEIQDQKSLDGKKAYGYASIIISHECPPSLKLRLDELYYRVIKLPENPHSKAA